MNVVHIGLERTGNTTLQNAIFSQQESFTYVGVRNDLYPDDRVRELIIRISSQDSLDYRNAETKALLRRICEDAPRTRPMLIASERFSLEGGADRRFIAERLRDLFAPAKVLIVLRAQTTIVQAQYLKHLSGLDDRIVPFETWLERNYGGIEFSDPYRPGLDYELLVRMYEDVFGFDNLVVLPSELMHEDNSIFQNRIAELLHMPLQAIREVLRRNVTDQRVSRRHVFAHRVQDLLLKDKNLALLGRRLLPRLVYDPIRRFVVGGPRVEAPALPERWRQRITELCAESNTRLESRLNLPLRALGYPVAG